MIKQRDKKIDVLYTIGIVLVLIGHSHPSDWTLFESTFFKEVIIFIYTFHMALFFFIAGYLLENSHSIEYYGYKKWIFEKAVRLLTPYIVLSVGALYPKYYLENHMMPTVKILLTAIFNPRKGIWGHFWFIPVLLMCYIFFGLWKRFITDRNKQLMTLVMLVISLGLYFLPLHTDWLGFNDFKEACIFVSIGIVVKRIISQRQENAIQKSHVVCRILCIIAATGLNIFMMRIEHMHTLVSLASAGIMIFACWELSILTDGNRLTLWVSSHNFTIYIYSWLFQSVFMAICGIFEMPWYITSMAMFIVGFAGPVVMIIIYEKRDKIHNRVFDLVLGIK